MGNGHAPGTEIGLGAAGVETAVMGGDAEGAGEAGLAVFFFAAFLIAGFLAGFFLAALTTAPGFFFAAWFAALVPAIPFRAAGLLLFLPFFLLAAFLLLALGVALRLAAALLAADLRAALGAALRFTFAALRATFFFTCLRLAFAI